MDELSRARPAPRAAPAPKPRFSFADETLALTRASPSHNAVAALCRALLSALRQATAKGTFTAAGVLAAFPRVCVLFEEICSEGVVEATDPDSLATGVRLKTAASA